MRFSIALCVLFCWLMPVESHGQIANLASSAGAINQSMGGAATAMPLDASGSQFWNPATITELETSELDINIAPVFPISTLASKLEANSIVPGLPPQNMSGSVENRAKFIIAPSVATVKKIKNSPWAWGTLTTGIGGSSVNFVDNKTNPFTAEPPIGTGDLRVQGGFLQFSGTLARKLGKHWSAGVQPSLNLNSFSAEPFGGVEPKDDDGDGIPTYPNIKKPAWTVGIGVQGGVYYHRGPIHLGAAVKSPQWFLPLREKGTFENGVERHFNINSNIPMIASVGGGFSGIPRVKMAVDARYVDFGNTTGFREVGFTSSGAGKGPGWKNIWAIASGIQYQVTERLSARIGYSYNPVPFPSQNTSFAVTSPSVMRQALAIGASYRYSRHCTLAASFRHDFAGTREGPIQSPNGPIPGSSVKLKTALNSFVISLIVQF